MQPDKVPVLYVIYSTVRSFSDTCPSNDAHGTVPTTNDWMAKITRKRRPWSTYRTKNISSSKIQNMTYNLRLGSKGLFFQRHLLTNNVYHGPFARYVNCELRMRRECRERFPHHQLQRKPLVSDPFMHHDTCDTRVPWCMKGSLTRGVGENVPGIPGVCTTRNFTYLVRGPWYA